MAAQQRKRVLKASQRPRTSPLDRVRRRSEKIFADEAEALALKTIQLGFAGNVSALRLALDVVFPRRDRTVAFNLPPLKSTADLPKALGAIAIGVADGVLTAAEAQALSQLCDAQRKAIETVDLEARIARLETEK
jgi:hypothetical protein